jgi:hypothetical protein
MHPTRDQIQYAAYERWLNRGRGHGHDRLDWLGAEKELSFSLNYQTIAEYRLQTGSTQVLGSRRDRTCRLCERTADEVSFPDPGATLPVFPHHELLTAQVCSECQSECLEPLAKEFQRFRDSRTGFTLGAFKALVASALLIVPARELAYFPDTIEWVNNPDPACDAGLFAGSSCRAYSTPTTDGRSSLSLARRVDDDVAMPYMVLFVSERDLVLQVDIPLSLRDEDLDIATAGSPERSWVWGHASVDSEAACRKLTVELPGVRHRPHGAASLIRC